MINVHVQRTVLALQHWNHLEYPEAANENNMFSEFFFKYSGPVDN